MNYNKKGSSKLVKQYGKDVSVDAYGHTDVLGTIKANGKFSERDKIIQDMEDIKNALSPEKIEANKKLVEARAKKIKTKFDEWLTRDHTTDFSNHIPASGQIIIKIFYYNEIQETTLILVEGALESTHKVYPIAMVVSSGDNTIYKPGDLVTIPAIMSKTVLSKEWVDYQSRVREQPTLKQELPEPPAYVGRLEEWRNYIYQRDPFTDTNIEDQHTFCIREGFIQSKRTSI